MKRSRAIQAFLVVSAATVLANCGQKHEAVRRCVDENGSFTEDKNCVAGAAVAGGAHHYAWVYAPAGASNKTEEGSPASSERSAETSRGVIGAEGAAHAGESSGDAGAGEGAGE